MTDAAGADGQLPDYPSGQASSARYIPNLLGFTGPHVYRVSATSQREKSARFV
jgi:hypothetical protein